MRPIIEWFKEDWPNRRWFIPLALSCLSLLICTTSLLITTLRLLKGG